jgi:integrase
MGRVVAITIAKDVSIIKGILKDLDTTGEWAWLFNSDSTFKSPRCYADAAVRTVAIRKQMKSDGVLAWDLTPVWVSVKDVIRHPENYGWHEWAVALMFSTGKRWYDLIKGRKVTLSGRHSLDWENLSKDNPQHDGNRTIFKAKKVLAVLRMLQDDIENVQHRTHAAVGNNFSAWFRTQKKMVALRKLKLAFDANFDGVKSKSAEFTPHNMRQTYVAWMCFQDDVDERWYTEEASALLGHQSLSGNGKFYAFLRHVPAQPESEESDFGPINTDDDDKENVVTRAAKKAKRA